MKSNNKDGGSNMRRDGIFKALSELLPAHPLEFGWGTPPLPRILARAICEHDTAQSGDKDNTDDKDDTTPTKPDVTRADDENVTNDRSDTSVQNEQQPD